jgi:hypothetical protein
MEVHHHPDLQHKKKNFKEYFFEFLMIFLAVTLGFFAEGLREHMGDKTKEKEYLSNMFGELKYDTAQYHISLNKINVLNPVLDSCYLNVKQADQFNYVLLAKWNTPVNEVGVIYKPALPTINQLKSSGNLRLIEEGPIATKVMEYETFIDGTYQDHCVSVQAGSSKVFAIEDELCDYTDFNAKLGENMKHINGQLNPEGSELYDMKIVIKDPAKLNALANSFVNFKANNYGYATGLNNAIKIATELLKSINDKYHFDKTNNQ